MPVRRARPTGKVNPIGVLLIAGILFGIYYIVMFGGAYLDNMDVMEAEAAAFNSFGHFPEERIRAEFKGALDKIGTHRELNQDGDLVEVRGLGVADEQITLERGPDEMIVIHVDYDREIQLKPSQKW